MYFKNTLITVFFGIKKGAEISAPLYNFKLLF